MPSFASDFDSRAPSRLPGPLNNNELVVMMVLVLGTCVFGIILAYLQFQNMWKTFRPPPSNDEISNLSADDVQSVRTAMQNNHQQYYQELAANVEGMKAMQREVKDKLKGLRQLVDTLSEQQKDEQEPSEKTLKTE